MRRFAYILCYLMLLGAPLLAQDVWDSAPKAPAGVKYNPLTAKVMRAESARVERILARGYAGQESLLGDVVVCGPGLWKTWKGLKFPPSLESIPATFHPGGEGRLFRGQSYRPLEDELRKVLAADGGFKTRRPTSAELARFWAIIDFDIEEPLMMIQSPRRVLLFYNGRMKWLDDYSSIASGGTGSSSIQIRQGNAKARK